MGLAFGLLAAGVVAGHFSKLKRSDRLNHLIYLQVLKQQKHLNSQPDTIQVNWLHTLNPLVQGVSGNISWSNRQQAGIMTFVGLPQLPSNQHYRLLIFDLGNRYNKPLVGASFNPVKSTRSPVLVKYSAPETIVKPFKFELVLAENNSPIVKSLLLAQP